MKYILVASVAILLVGCGKPPSPSQWVVNADSTPQKLTINGLQDCTAYNIDTGSGGRMRIVRCPNSNVSVNYKNGKATMNETIIDQSSVGVPVDNNNVESTDINYATCMDVGDKWYVLCSKYRLRGQ